MILNSLLVAAGGFFGAIARYGMSQWVGKRVQSVFPYGTLSVNLAGSFLLGLTVGSGLSTSVILLLGTGFLGAFTTFSTFKLESVRLAMKKQWNLLVRYLGVSYTLGILLGFLGYAAGTLLKG